MIKADKYLIRMMLSIDGANKAFGVVLFTQQILTNQLGLEYLN
ncbi:hypothetical protein [Fischerella thermalis]